MIVVGGTMERDANSLGACEGRWQLPGVNGGWRSPQGRTSLEVAARCQEILHALATPQK